MTTRRIAMFFSAAAAFPGVLSNGVAQPDNAARGEYMACVGTYTSPNKSKGISAWRFQPAAGKLTLIGLVADTVSPSFLAMHPNRRFLYAVNERSDYEGGRTGSVSAFALDSRTGRLALLNTVSTRGGDPCHLALDR